MRCSSSGAFLTAAMACFFELLLKHLILLQFCLKLASSTACIAGPYIILVTFYSSAHFFNFSAMSFLLFGALFLLSFISSLAHFLISLVIISLTLSLAARILDLLLAWSISCAELQRFFVTSGALTEVWRLQTSVQMYFFVA